MCHLTVTKQTQFNNANLLDFVQQFNTVLTHYQQDTVTNLVHINWMARGEPLANPTVTETGTELLWELGNICRDHNLVPKFNVSTIMPVTLRKSLTQCFPLITPTIYYSLYSVDPQFRRRWLPGAMPVAQALEQLKHYQQVSKKIIKIHGAFIEGENDSDDSVMEMMSVIRSHSIRAEFNVVRYNPFSPQQGRETTRLTRIQQLISRHMPCKIITRVGEDVAASCGTFVT